MVAADEYRRLTAPQPDFQTFLLSGPDLSPLDLDHIERDLPRGVSL